MISPPRRSASRNAISDLPTAVGPARTRGCALEGGNTDVCELVRPHSDPLPQEREQPGDSFGFSSTRRAGCSWQIIMRRRGTLPLAGGEGRVQHSKLHFVRSLFCPKTANKPAPAAKIPKLSNCPGVRPACRCASV